MKCNELKEQFFGIFDFIACKRVGKAILTKRGKEYFVEYQINGEEVKNSKKRTFEGIRLMIIGNRLKKKNKNKNYFHLLLFFYYCKQGCWKNDTQEEIDGNFFLTRKRKRT